MPDHLKLPRARPRASLSTGHQSVFAGRMGVNVLIGLLALSGVAGCASAGPYNPSDLPTPQLSQVQELCHLVMGIPPGVGLSSDCVENLSSSAAALSQGRTLLDARRTCLGKGLAPGQPGLSQCELATASQRSAWDVQVDTTGLQRPAKSYVNASFDEVRRREQDACARLGYDPINAGFAQCVASLNAALLASAHPMQ